MKLVEEVADHPSEHSHEGMNPVAHRLALNNGSQCGYCSVGFVMNMSEFIINNPKATKKEIEDAFDGNLCRCTGYRPILTGMKTFASDWSKADETDRMPCYEDHVSEAQLPADVAIPFPKEARGPAEPVSVHGDGQEWRTPISLNELAEILTSHRGQKIRLVHGNTSYGVYKDEYPGTKLFVDIRLIPEMHGAGGVTNNELIVAAGTTYSDLIEMIARRKPGATTALGALDFMARRTAGRIVRNAASLGGNTMMVLKHIPKGTGEPFPSDLFTALVAVEARISYLVLKDSGEFEQRTETAAALVAAVLKDSSLADRIVLTSYALPLSDSKEPVLAQKVALREVNAHSIVNATTRFTFGKKLTVDSATLVFGGIAPYPWRASKTEKEMVGKELSLASFGPLSKILANEVDAELKLWADRMKEVPDEGFTAEYRRQLAVSFLYKAIVNTLVGKGVAVPDNVKSSGEITWGNWPESTGIQKYQKQDFKAPVAQPYIKVTAMYQTSGQLHYTQELAVPPLTANGAFVQSRRALMNYRFVIRPIRAIRRRLNTAPEGRFGGGSAQAPERLCAFIHRPHHVREHQERRHQLAGNGSGPAALRDRTGQLRRPIDRHGPCHYRNGGDPHCRLRVSQVRRLLEAGETVDREMERAHPRSVRRDREGQHFSRCAKGGFLCFAHLEDHPARQQV